MDSQQLPGEDQIINVVIKLSGNQEFKVQIPPETEIEEFKEFISQITNDKTNEIKLIAKGKILKDDQTLTSYGIKDMDSVVYVVNKPKDPKTEEEKKAEEQKKDPRMRPVIRMPKDPNMFNNLLTNDKI